MIHITRESCFLEKGPFKNSRKVKVPQNNQDMHIVGKTLQHNYNYTQVKDIISREKMP